MNEIQFPPGSIVELNSGSPPLIVLATLINSNKSEAEHQIVVYWIEINEGREDIYHSNVFPASCLIRTDMEIEITGLIH